MIRDSQLLRSKLARQECTSKFFGLDSLHRRLWENHTRSKIGGLNIQNLVQVDGRSRDILAVHSL